jgi:hypothetical protein
MKYGNIRIEAVQRCGACGGTGVLHQGTCPGCVDGEVRTPLLLDGEPFFLVRGKDELAQRIVAIYGVLYGQAHGMPAGEWPEDLERRLAAIREWQDANPGLVKRPD